MSHALYFFIVTILGCVFGSRIAHHFISRDLFDRTLMTKIGTTYLVCVIALSTFLPRTHLMMWLAIFSPLMILALALLSSVSRRSNHFKRDVLSVLSSIVLKMKSGRSFRQSLLETTQELDPHLRAKFTEIMNVVAFSQQSASMIRDPFVHQLIEEFVLIDQNPHASMRRLSVLRERIRIEEDFRRRSGQVLARQRAQSLIMCGLYLAIFVFMVWKFGWHANVSALTASLIFFSVGVAWMWMGGRRMQWKV